MSGILPGIALVNNFDQNGELMRGAKLYTYLAGTNTPAVTFKDAALTAGQEQPWPIQADSAARLPMFYVASGDYRARLSSSDGGYVAYDVPVLTAVEPSGGGGGGGGGGTASGYQTADIKYRFGSGIHAGFVRVNGRSIGSENSGASERANSDTRALYEYIYDEFSDAICPVVGGRSGDATTDFNANKALILPDARGRLLFGADGMGASRANRLTSASFATADVIGTAGGAELHTLVKAELPNVAPTFAGSQTTVSGSLPDVATGNANSTTPGGGFSIKVPTGLGSSFTSNPFTPAGTISPLGDGQPFATVPPGMIVTIYVKL